MFQLCFCAKLSGGLNLLTAGSRITIGIRNESNLAALRKKTGYALKLCKEALESNEQDLSKAEAWLKKEAIKHGWEKSVQLQNRLSAQGLVGVHVDSANKTGFLVELNCETDFVARNNLFKNLVADLTQTMASAPLVQLTEKHPHTTSSLIRKYEINQFDLEIFRDKISTAIAQLGENIKMRRATILVNDSKDSDVHLFGYTHASSGENVKIGDVQMGKYGTIIALKQLPEKSGQKPIEYTWNEPPSPTAENQDSTSSSSSSTSEESSASDSDTDDAECSNEQEIVKLGPDEVAKILSQQIIAMKATCLDLTEEQLTDERKKQESDGSEMISDALLRQKLLINDRVTVKDYLNFQNVEIVQFVRFESGESTQ